MTSSPTPRFSIIVPSLGNVTYLRRLFESLAIQEFCGPVELILCITRLDQSIQKSLPQLPESITPIYIESAKPGISTARNLGIEAARGDVVLFLDEDCFLPNSQYLSELSAFCQEQPDLSGGGMYLTLDGEANFGSAFYNYVCNSWVRSHASPAGDADVLLGGCCFYPRRVLTQTNIVFPEHKPRAGEEKDFNSDVLKQGHRLKLDLRWSVYHNPNYSLNDIFKRAWLHGQSLENRALIPQPKRLAKFASESQEKPGEFIKFLPMTLAYSLWGRAAYVAKFFQ